MSFVTEDVQIIHHILNQEQAPSPCCLSFSQLGFKIRFASIWNELTIPLVANTYCKCCLRGKNLDSYRNIGLIVVAMFHRVHRRLSHSSFDLLKSLRRQVKHFDNIGNLLHNLTLVARLTRYSPFIESLPVIVSVHLINLSGRPGCGRAHSITLRSLQCQQCDIIFLLPIRSGKGCQFTQYNVDENTTPWMLANQCFEAWQAKHLMVG